MKSNNHPAPKEGYVIVTEGTLLPGDLVWDKHNYSWGAPDEIDLLCIGRDIPHYYAVCRKAVSQQGTLTP